MPSSPFESAAWHQVAPYLDEALSLDEEERQSWLARINVQKPEIAKLVHELLADRDRLNAQGFLENSQLRAPPLNELGGAAKLLESATPGGGGWRGEFFAGMCLGDYRLIREIGRGGMSTVWLGERRDGGLKRNVALKLPFTPSHRWRLAERFDRERDILARLTHPHIARLYDAGVDPSGQPYLVMEYIDGIPLTAYCDNARLTVRERLKIFRQVLDAVEYAHSQLVLHRDLKPSNILVTAQGHVALLDFGIAKMLSREAPDNPTVTEFSARALTPEYASPEQIDARVLSTATDVYSLGVVLYELLSGMRPYRAMRDSAAALAEAILLQQPRMMSQCEFDAEITTRRGTTAAKLARSLKGDLDVIALKALKKAPQERYRSVADFSQDIFNHLSSIPVRARPDSLAYRAARFLSRYRVQTTTAAIGVLAVLGGGAAAMWQAHAAAEQRDRAVALANRNTAVTDFLNSLMTEAAGSDKPVSVGAMVARSERLVLANTKGNPETRAAILQAIAEYYGDLGDYARASSLFERAIQLTAHSRDRALRTELICLQAYTLWVRGDAAHATQILDREIDHDTENSTSGTCLVMRANVADESGDAAGALNYALRALTRLPPESLSSSPDAGVTLGAVARGYFVNGHYREADHYFRMAMDSFIAQGRDGVAEATTVQNNWAILAAAAGIPRQSLALYDEIKSKLQERNPEGVLPAYLLANRAISLEELGRFQEASAIYLQGLDTARKGHDFPGELFCLLHLASTSDELHDNQAAAAYIEQASHLLSTSSLPKNAPPYKLRFIVQGRVDLSTAQFQAALEQFNAALALNLSPNMMTIAQLGRAEAELQTGNAAAGLQHAREALAGALKGQGGLEYSDRAGLSWLSLGRAYAQLGRQSDAHHAFEMALLNLSATVDVNHPALIQVRQLLGRPEARPGVAAQ